ncbi:MAG: hypothetical protein WC455_12090 [Dehalococcoidia bacterium]|jgi:hypothetical protein
MKRVWARTALQIIAFICIVAWVYCVNSNQDDLDRRLKDVEAQVDSITNDTYPFFESVIWEGEHKSGVALYYHYRGHPADSNQIIDSIRTILRNPADTLPAVWLGPYPTRPERRADYQSYPNAKP